MAVNVAIGLVYYLRFLVVLLRPSRAGAWPTGAALAEVDEEWEGLDAAVPWSTEFVVGVTLAASWCSRCSLGCCSARSRPDVSASGSRA